MKILLVDAHPVVREGFSGLLQSAIPEVVILQAATGEQALERTSLDIPALVVTDISLPGISGLETCRRLLQRLPQLPVLFFSAHTELALVR